MCWNLNDYQFKQSRYNYGSTYMNPKVTTNQKPTVDTRKPKDRNPSILEKKIIKPQWEKQKDEEMNRKALQKQSGNRQ